MWHKMASLETGQPKPVAKKYEGSPLRLYFTVAVVCFGPLAFGFAIGYSAPTIPKLKKEGLLNNETESWFASLLTVGAMIGGPLAGFLIDRIGRRGTLMFSGFLFVVGFIFIMKTGVIMCLFIGRFICGIASGQITVCAPVYIAEVSTKSLRGLLGACNQLSITIGILLAYELGGSLSFVKLALWGVIPGAITLFASFLIPETPRWLLLLNRKQDALKSLAALRGPHCDIEEECRDIQEGLESKETVSWSELRRPEYSRPLFIALCIMALQQFTGINAVMFYTVSIFDAAKLASSQEATVTIGKVQVVATAVACLMMDRMGRRKLLIIAGSVMGVSCMTFAYYFFSVADSTAEAEKMSWLAVGSLVMYIIGFSLGWGPIPMLVMSELVPARVKGACSGIALFTSWFTAFLVTQGFSYAQDIIGPSFTFAFFGICCMFSVMFVSKYLPETKGKSLEDIELYFLGKTLG